MDREFINRLEAKKTARKVLEEAQFKTIWENQPPKIFTTKVGEADTIIGEIEAKQQAQETGTSGPTGDKALEEAQLEDADFVFAQAVVLYAKDHPGEVDVSGLDIVKTDWVALGGVSLLGRSQQLIDVGNQIIAGPNALVAVDYGITAAAVANVVKERKDYDEIVNAPSVAIAIRAALTKGFRAGFRLLDQKFAELDGLILQFGTTAAGKAMIKAWIAGEVIKGLGQGTPAKVKPAAPASGTGPAKPA